ncbi:GH116 family glycosyl hydrolase [Novipirellula artificiosorum]|uniref:Glycosyl-hydrolase family 116 catalytic region domain-containing protein n=1 Tax=Novipirellula artificiosorum TaxID=2528016 RepID=A0A5C6DNL1_9BACT|nr:GH116 family glycosyl hydrolase [Novipirellula artificiosorum]TWU38308.1 hypothetical protein Poly41_27840 [Novipirellula artificiosorum]
MKENSDPRNEQQTCQSSSCECSQDSGLQRRKFLTLVGAGAGVVGISGVTPSRTYAERPSNDLADHFVPEDKQLTKEWLHLLTAKGERKPYREEELQTIGMPCGGIAAGQLYVLGDGSLGYWWIANNSHNTGYGKSYELETPMGTYPVCYPDKPFTPPAPVDQGFALRVGNSVRQLNQNDYDDIEFIGEYPVATLRYLSKNESLPVQVEADVFSPFIPLNARDSANPATILRYTVENTSDEQQEIAIAGWLQNPVGLSDLSNWHALNQNVVTDMDGKQSVQMCAIEKPKEVEAEPVVKLFEDFEAGYENWIIEGEAFGEIPADGTLPGQQRVSGFRGKKLVNTFLGGNDGKTGTATSSEFEIELPYVVFLIGGGSHEGTAIQLLVNDTVVKSTAGKSRESLQTGYWDVTDLVGKRARIRILDSETGGWGHVNVDHIYFSDQNPLARQPYDPHHRHAGDVSLTALAENSTAVAAFESRAEFLRAFGQSARLSGVVKATHELGATRVAGVSSATTLAPGEKATIDFLLTWYFPNRGANGRAGWGGEANAGERVGNRYNQWYSSSQEVAKYLADHFQRLTTETALFRDTYFDSSLPYWFLQRVGMPLANLATETVTWREDGYLWAWEGVGCCSGNCGHVWNYAQGMARLFPELERSVREFQDFDPKRGYREQDGAIFFRGVQVVDWSGGWAGDAMGGYILKAFREYTCSKDDAFLKRYWPQIRKSIQFLMRLDGEDGSIDGLIQGKQHNTYDIDYYGANTLVGALYLAALKAGQKMAEDVGDRAFAKQCQTLAKKGAESTMKQIWNEEYGYFVQNVDLAKHPKNQQGDGCLADQLFGQSFAHQLNLGYLYPQQAVQKTVNSIWKYNWAPDIAPQNQEHPPERWYCRPGEAGLFMCTWPKSKHLGPTSVRYRDEVWTGTEYQVAAHMLYEGMVTEGLAIVRAIHERYDGIDHNPWNEIECGDHYARALASWGCLLGVSGFSYHGPKGQIGFAPKQAAEAFRCFFSAAEGWGTFCQTRADGKQTATLKVKWGSVALNQFTLEVPEEKKVTSVTIKGATDVAPKFTQSGNRVTILFRETIVVKPDSILAIKMV